MGPNPSPANGAEQGVGFGEMVHLAIFHEIMLVPERVVREIVTDRAKSTQLIDVLLICFAAGATPWDTILEVFRKWANLGLRSVFGTQQLPPRRA
tara:strand:+ start:1026 stop:1310 length:285 start_codon:yes stop_codon:yes gene_type:complete